MNHVHVDQAKNINVVVELYKKIIREIKDIKTKLEIIIIDFFDCNI